MKEKLAAVPLNITAVAPLKFEPLIVTLVPATPAFGVNPAIDGDGWMLFKNAVKTFAVARWIRGSTTL
jgi:hypothetical protein